VVGVNSVGGARSDVNTSVSGEQLEVFWIKL